MTYHRPDWHQYFFKIAQDVASRSTCIRPGRQFGCVLVKDKTPISTGYNGAPRGCPHCIELGCAREGIPSGEKQELCRATHAEQNAIANAARHGINTLNSELYLNTATICTVCVKSLINAGIVAVHLLEGEQYPGWELSQQYLMNSGVKVILHKRE